MLSPADTHMTDLIFPATGLGSNIFRLLDSLRALSGQAGCRLRALHLSDLFSPLPILELTRAIVRALPLLRVLSIRVDHPSQRDNPAVPGNTGPPSHIIGDEEIPGEALCTHVSTPICKCTGMGKGGFPLQVCFDSFLAHLESFPPLEATVLYHNLGLDKAHTTVSLEGNHSSLVSIRGI